MTRHRLFFATLVLVTIAGMLAMMVRALDVDGLDAVDVVMLVLFGITLPWLVVGFWNATIGFLIMSFSADPVGVVLPQACGVAPDAPITASTAILLCIRNESPRRILRNLELTLSGLAQTGAADRFHVYVLSDTNDARIATEEQVCFAELASRWEQRLALTYRCRTANAGYKAGNIEDFCRQWGDLHDFAIVLDADSFMTPPAMLRLIRIMQGNPSIGILQGLVVAMPSTSAFARIFQFGMRLGMRSYTMGSAWWQGDCGPYWGHNAVLRLDAFMQHCELPTLSADGSSNLHILSHDQVEAVLMRRGGYEVRVLPREDQSWEENPPTMLDFVRRDLRWCEGNMQYLRLLGMPGLKPTSRVQLLLAIMMFIGSPAWVGMLVLGTAMVVLAPQEAHVIDPVWGRVLVVVVLVMMFLPKIASAVDVLVRPVQRRQFGGGALFSLSFFIETVFSILICPIMWLSQAIFLSQLLFGRTQGWSSQTRDDHTVGWGQALGVFWPHLLLGTVLLGSLAVRAPLVIPYAIFFLGGFVMAVPLAVVTSWPSVARFFIRAHIASLPEEITPPAELRALQLPVFAMRASFARQRER